MARYQVYYHNDISAIYTRDLSQPDMGDYKQVCTIDGDDLEQVFRQMNVVDGTELPVQLQVRSMCCGDLVLDMATNEWWLCDLAGWKQVMPAV